MFSGRFVVLPLLASSWVSSLRNQLLPSYSITELPGHSEEINGQANVGDLERMWFEQYGSIWRLKGCLGVCAPSDYWFKYPF